jgi:predicted  nucleic acid-binding Zn-ribbon protein
MAEQRENYEKHLSNREKSVQYLRELAEKRQRDLEKAEAVSRNYLDRIDAKNRQLEERDAEIRRLTSEILRISASHNEEIKGFIDRILRMSDFHAAEIKAMSQIVKPQKE